MSSQPRLDDRVRSYLARSAARQAPPGLADRVSRRIREAQPARRPYRLTQALSVAALLLIAIALAYAGLVAHQNASRSRVGPKAVVPEAALSFVSMKMVTPTTGWAFVRAPIPGRPGVAQPLIVRTTDGGLHWHIATASPSGKPFSTDFIDANTAWVATVQPGRSFTVIHTTDGGANWRVTQITDSSVGFAVYLDFIDAAHGWILVGYDPSGGSSPGAIYRTVDGGQDWELASRTGGIGSTTGALPLSCNKSGITFISVSTGWVTGNCLGGGPFFYVTNDAGKTWREQRLPGILYSVPGGASPPMIFSPSSAILRAVAEEGFLYVTGDGGRTWAPHGLPEYASPAGISFIDVNRGWLINQGGTVLYHTTDSGLHWSATNLNRPLGFSADLDFVNPRVGFAVASNSGGAARWKTVDGGISWSPISTAGVVD